jgi:CDP-glycerol:poly(glycerophosphate) glycerophosphotransferase
MKKEVYYYANHTYQFSYALPIYNLIGGIFVVKDLKRFLQFKRYLIDLAKFDEKTFLKTPRVIIRSRKDLHALKGVIFFLSNSIMPKDDFSDSVTIFHEHGTSDKRYGGAKTHNVADLKLKKYDHIFLSGPKNLKRLEEIDLHFSEKKLVRIGGLRFDKYFANSYNRENEFSRLKIKDRSRKNILYAPTWRFGNGTLKQYGLRFAEEITKEFNLIIRPHYHDYNFSRYLKFQARLKGLQHIYFSNASNIIKQDTFNDFILADLMISDMSSVIYEFLITGRPMIIVKNDFSNFHKMPKNLDIMQNVDIYDGSQAILAMVRENLEQQKFVGVYNQMAKDCFYVEGSSVKRATDFIEKLRDQEKSS